MHVCAVQAVFWCADWTAADVLCAMMFCSTVLLGVGALLQSVGPASVLGVSHRCSCCVQERHLSLTLSCFSTALPLCSALRGAVLSGSAGSFVTACLF